MRWIGWLFGRGRAPVAPATAHASLEDADGLQPVTGPATPPLHWSVRLAGLALPVEAAPGPQQARLLSEVEAALLRLLHERVRLPRRPQLLPQLLGMLNDDRASSRQIAEVIGRDPALATNLLRVANSPMYRVQSSPVQSLDRAVALVGTDGLRQLVAVALMQPVMHLEGGATGSLPQRVWEHTELAAGIAARNAAGRGRDAVFAAQLLALLRSHNVALVNAASDEHPSFGDLTADFSYARIMQARADLAEGYRGAELDAWAARARAWSTGDDPADLPHVGPLQDTAEARDVFVFFIAAAKERNPAAAVALLRRLAADGAA